MGEGAIFASGEEAALGVGELAALAHLPTFPRGGEGGGAFAAQGDVCPGAGHGRAEVGLRGGIELSGGEVEREFDAVGDEVGHVEAPIGQLLTAEGKADGVEAVVSRAREGEVGRELAGDIGGGRGRLDEASLFVVEGEVEGLIGERLGGAGLADEGGGADTLAGAHGPAVEPERGGGLRGLTVVAGIAVEGRLGEVEVDALAALGADDHLARREVVALQGTGHEREHGQAGGVGGAAQEDLVLRAGHLDGRAGDGLVGREAADGDAEAGEAVAGPGDAQVGDDEAAPAATPGGTGRGGLQVVDAGLVVDKGA